MEVNVFLVDMVYNAGYSGMHGRFWLGLNDIEDEGTFVWASSNTSPSFTFWRPGEPNDQWGNEDCVHIVHDFYAWNDLECSQKLGFICQFR